MSTIADRIREAARRVAIQGAPVHHIFVCPSTYSAIEEWQWTVAIEEQIDLTAPTYERRTTLRSQLRAAAKMARRRGLRFDARTWWARVPR